MSGSIGATYTGTIAGSVSASIPFVADVGSVTGTIGNLAAGAVDQIWDEVVDGITYTGRQTLRLMNSFVAAKVTGAGTVQITFRDLDDGRNRIIMDVDASGNRSSVTWDVG